MSTVDLGYSAIEGISARKDLTDSEKQKMAAGIIETMRYGNGEYLWINDMQPSCIPLNLD